MALSGKPFARPYPEPHMRQPAPRPRPPVAPRGTHLRADEDVGAHARVLDVEVAPRARVAGLHLVDHEQHPVPVAHLAQPAQERGRRGHVPALAEHGLDQHRGRVARAARLREQQVQLVQAHLRQRRRRRVGRHPELVPVRERDRVRARLDEDECGVSGWPGAARGWLRGAGRPHTRTACRALTGGGPTGGATARRQPASRM